MILTEEEKVILRQKASDSGLERWGPYRLDGDLGNELVSFAEVCVAMGMERAAKICESYPRDGPGSGDYENDDCRWAAADRAEAIRKAAK